MRWVYAVVVGCILHGFSPPTAHADFLAAFTGNSQMTDQSGTPPGAQGVVSFAVYANAAGHNWAADLGLPVTPLPDGNILDLMARYVYMYQVVNIGVPGPTIENFKVSGTNWTSGGYLLSTVFTDAAGHVNFPNTGLGPNPVADDPIDGVPSAAGPFLTGFAPDGASVNPTDTDLAFGGDGNGFTTFSFVIPTIPSEGWSSVVFLTSDSPPSYLPGTIQDGGVTSDGDIPSSVPEPASMVMAALGIAGCGSVFGWRRRKVAPAQ
jgi:hypothetical protein